MDLLLTYADHADVGQNININVRRCLISPGAPFPNMDLI